MSGHSKIIVTFVLLLLFSTQHSYAQAFIQDSVASTDSIRVYSIDEVTVSSNRVHHDIVPVQKLSGEALQNFATYSIADALRYFSGIQVKDYGGIGGLKTVNIRSMGTNHVGVFYDGIELGNAQNGTIDLGKFSLDNLESVSLYNGQRGDVLQTAKDYGASGSIYLQSRQPQFIGNERWHLTAALKGGSFFTVNPSLQWEQRIGNRCVFALGMEYLYTSGRYKFTYTSIGGHDTTAMRRNGDVNALRTEFGLFGTLPHGSWRVKGYTYHSQRGYPGAVVRGRFYNQDRQWDDNLFLQGTYKSTFGWYSLMLKTKYAYDYLHYLSDPRLDASVMYVENFYHQQEIYFSNVHAAKIFPIWDISIACDIQWNKLNANLYNFVYPQRLGVFIAAATTLNVKHLKMQVSLLHNAIFDRLRTQTDLNSRSAWSPAVSLAYKPWLAHDFLVRAFAKRSMRMPTFNDLYYTFIGNALLKPEYTNQYNIGLCYNRPLKCWIELITMQVDGYFNQVENKIVATPTSNFFRWTMINLGYVEIAGIDAALQAHVAFGLNWTGSLRLNYTYQQARDLTNPNDSYYGGQIPYIPWHSGSTSMEINYKKWCLHYSFIYTGERFNSVANIAENYERPWYTHDIALSTLFEWAHADLHLILNVNNLFNQRYEVVHNYPMPGTNFKITTQITVK